MKLQKLFLKKLNALQRTLSTQYLSFVILGCLICLTCSIVQAQSTSFVYQGKLSDNSLPADGIYEMQFRLFDGNDGGSQIGEAVNNPSVTVSQGVFTVWLDYGAAAFDGSPRYLEIGVKPQGNPNPYTVLSPRQAIASTPYAIRSLKSTTADSATNSNQLGGVTANQFVQINDSRLADDRNPLPNSSNYIQNTTNQQWATNFNISGNGTANVFNAATQFNIGGNRVLSVAGTNSISAGINAGNSNPGLNNSFFGAQAGKSNTTGGFNAFFGSFTGRANLSGGSNSFFGDQSGLLNTSGSQNVFIGTDAGLNNFSGGSNSFLGAFVGTSNTTGSENTFVGIETGHKNTTGNNNSFFGSLAGYTNSSGSNNTIVGSNADVGTGNLTNANAFGTLALVTQNNSLVLGSINGVNNATADTKVGIGTTAPKALFHIAVNSGNILQGDAGCSTGYTGIGFASTLTCTNYSLLGNGNNTIINRPTGGAIIFRENNVTQMTISTGGKVSILNLGSGGNTQLCLNASNQISNCSSSLRYKTNIKEFNSGLSIINQLQPITFNWKEGGMLDLGLGAEEVAKINELMVIRNTSGEIEGVKYDRIGVVLVNAVKEQQTQIETQARQIEQQQLMIDGLKKLVCSQNPNADVCK